ncbi:hypothetical protein PIB30_085622 [Stylosanthes scabra]|uniref:Uncharacterized protein n=1 Tax=Stylosanthes scabra TaxID=79078 RepID=A0ABU6ST49_9FABA|nr:hypothetical protein [Stylosanthes scabra]
MVKASLFIDAETHWCVRTEPFSAYALGSVLNSGRASQGEVVRMHRSFGAYAQGFLTRNHEVTEEEEVKQSKVA